MRGPNDTYWDEYTNLQHVKHKVIREYLNGWFPKLGFWSGRILYIDTHAGRGQHVRGQEGSPIVAMRTFLEHDSRDRILSKCELKLFFLESNEENVKHLETALQPYAGCHPKITWSVLNANSFEVLEHLVQEFEREGRNFAPSFMFVDPYGYKLPYPILKRLKAQPRSELLINVMWRELDMAIRNPASESTMNELFGCDDWLAIREIHGSDTRAEAAVQLLRKQLGSQWATYIRMIDSNRTRYFLLHLTDHEDGRDLMKSVIWKCCPEGGYFARKSDNPNQQYLITPEPHLKPLEMWLIDKLSRKPYNWDELTKELRDEIWLNKHLWQVIRELRKSSKIAAANYEGRFSQKSNPTFSLE